MDINVSTLFIRALHVILFIFFSCQCCDAFARPDQTQPELLPNYEAVVESGVMNLTCLYIYLARPTTISFQHSSSGRMLITAVPNATILEVDKAFKDRQYEVLVHRIDRQHYLLRRFTAAVSLLVYNVSGSDRGGYRCYVNSLLSVATSSINVVRKLPKLNFTVTPRSVLLGTAVTALCAAEIDNTWDMKSNFALQVVVPAIFKDVTSVLLLPLSTSNESATPGWTIVAQAYSYRPLRPTDGRDFVQITCQIVDRSECIHAFTQACEKVMLSLTENVFVLSDTNQTAAIVTLSVYPGVRSVLLSCNCPFGESFGVDYYVYSDSNWTSRSLQVQPMAWLFSQRREPLSDVVALPANNFDNRSKLPVNVTGWYAERGLRVSRVRVSITDSTAPSFIFRCRIRNEFGEIDSPLTRPPASPVVQLPQSDHLPLDKLVAPIGSDVVVACMRFIGEFRIATLSVTSSGVGKDVAVALSATSFSGRTYLTVITTGPDQFVRRTVASLSLSDADYRRALSTGAAPANSIFFIVRNLTTAEANRLAFSCRVQTDLASYSSNLQAASSQHPILFASPTELQSDCVFLCLFPTINRSLVRSVLLTSQTAPTSSSFFTSPNDSDRKQVVNSSRLQFTSAQFYEVIRFTNATQSDDVYYACTVQLQNGSDTAVRSAYVSIPLFRSARFLPTTVSSRSLVSNFKVDVACELTTIGYPFSVLTLAYTNGSSVSLNRTLAFASCEVVAGNSFTPTSSSNGGALVCEAYSPAVLDTPVIRSDTQLEVLYPVADVDVYVEPRQLLATSMVNGYEVLAVKPQARILCRADGNPAGEAVWLGESDSPFEPARSQWLNASALPVQSYLDFIAFRCSASNTIHGYTHNAYRVFGVRIIRGALLQFFGHDPSMTLPTIASLLSVSVLVLITVIFALRSRISNYFRHHSHSIPFFSHRPAARASQPFRIRYSAHANASNASNPYGRMMEEEEYDVGGVQIEFTPDNVPDEAPPAYDAVSRLPPTELNVGYRRPRTIRMPPPAYDASYIPNPYVTATATIPQSQPQPQPVAQTGVTEGSALNA